MPIKLVILLFVKNLFCKHAWIQVKDISKTTVIDSKEYNQSLFVCNKCGKTKWVLIP